MAHEIDVQWMGKMQFNALVNGHTIVMDGPEKVGGEDNGPIPKPFVLTALAGCTGMDIAAILRRADKNPDSFEMKVVGEISKKAPIEYIAIHLIYEFKGTSENREAALAAVNDSQEKYCGVSSMLKKALPVTWEVKYNGEQIFNNKVAEELSIIAG
ncbi:MAG TPA: OsmC family protein [Niabella sp.]|nr:OsmC family protein [Niabella sp.]HQW14960.1 OsmC family protein [Niabella sp.]HQX20148.1 OsmC family protein [Niabella sp.]HRB06753.1 OsmC family protein [Niabella sp.]HRB27578.1 OsmC family protein [Niabella sp.]